MRLTLVSPVLMWLIIIAGALLAILLLPDRALFRGMPWALLPVGLLWLAVLAAGFVRHRAAPRSAAAVPRLVSSGPYRHVRHPMYAMDLLLMLALMVAFPQVDVIAAAAFAIIIFLVWMRLEELALLQRFGDEYRRYMERTPMLLPRLRRP